MSAVRKKWKDLSESEKTACYDALAGRPFWHDKDGYPYEVSPRKFARLYAKEQRANAETDALARTPMVDVMLLVMARSLRDADAVMLGAASDGQTGGCAGTAGPDGAVGVN